MNLNLSTNNISADLSHKKIPEKYQYLFSEKYFLFLNAVLEKMVSGHQKLMLQTILDMHILIKSVCGVHCL